MGMPTTPVRKWFEWISTHWAMACPGWAGTNEKPSRGS